MSGTYKLAGNRRPLDVVMEGGKQWRARLMGLAHHTDAERDWAYDRQFNKGKGVET
jgi:hypothetical protein